MYRVPAGAVPSHDEWVHASRALTEAEVQRLEAGGNSCLPSSTHRRPWDCVRVLRGSAFEPACVRGSTFGGSCVVLGAFGVGGSAAAAAEAGEAASPVRLVVVDGVELPAGVYGSTIVDSMVCDGARVAQTTLLARAYVGRNAVVQGCGTVCMTAAATAAGGSAFANGRVLSIAIETGGRELAMFAEMTLEDAAHVVGNRRDAAALAAWRERARRFAETVATHTRAVVCDDAQLLNCPRVVDAYVGPGARVEASTVEDATVLSAGPHAPTVVEGGCLLEHSIVQWGCRCASMAVVSSSFLCAGSGADRHAKVLGSVLGPCSTASEGEVSSSLLGFVCLPWLLLFFVFLLFAFFAICKTCFAFAFYH